MIKIFKYIKNKFNPIIEPIITVSSDITLHDCPNCNSKHSLIFYYNSSDSFYRCTMCLTKIDNKKYTYLYNQKIRKEKLIKLQK